MPGKQELENLGPRLGPDKSQSKHLNVGQSDAEVDGEGLDFVVGGATCVQGVEDAGQIFGVDACGVGLSVEVGPVLGRAGFVFAPLFGTRIMGLLAVDDHFSWWW